MQDVILMESSSFELDSIILKDFEDEYIKISNDIKILKDICQTVPQNYFELIINLKKIQRQSSVIKKYSSSKIINLKDLQEILNRVKNIRIQFYALLIQEKPDIFFKMLPSIQIKFRNSDCHFSSYLRTSDYRIMLDSSPGFMILLVRKYIKGIENRDLNQFDLNQDIAKIFAVSFYISFSYNDRFNMSVIVEALKRLNSIKLSIKPGKILAYYLYYKNSENGLLIGNIDSSGISDMVHLLLVSSGLNKYFIDFIETVSELISFKEFSFLINNVIFGDIKFNTISGSSNIKLIARDLLKDCKYPEELYSKMSAEELIYTIGNENRLIDQELLRSQFQITAIERVHECFEYFQKKFIGYRTDITAIRLTEVLIRDLNQMVKLATTLIQNGVTITTCVQDNDFPIIIWNMEDVTEEIQTLIGGLNDAGLNIYIVNLKDLDNIKRKYDSPSSYVESGMQIPF